jgi:predicted nucleic acid-binding protein
MTFLLDTCLVSELTKPSPDPYVVSWIRRNSEISCYISVLTLGKITNGIRRLPESAKRTKLETWMNNELRPRFKDRIILVNELVAIRWGILIAEMRNKGKVLSTIDSLLAATAQEYKLTIVTRNVKDFQNIDVKVLNPWQESGSKTLI